MEHSMWNAKDRGDNSPLVYLENQHCDNYLCKLGITHYVYGIM